MTSVLTGRNRKLLAGTPDGVYRVDGAVECVLPGVSVRQLHTRGSSVFTATDGGLFRTDDGSDWQQVETPVTNVYTVLTAGGRLLVGVLPAAVLVSTDGDTFERLSGFERLADSAAWPTNPHREQACVRSLAAPKEGVLLAGVEVGGLAVSRDGGETWRTVPSVPDDVHHVLPVTEERWVVSCGTGGPETEGGVFETRDGGDTWTRRDTGPYRYVRESCHRGRLYTAGNRTAPPWTPPDAALFVGRDGDLEPVSYPGEPTAFVISWTGVGDRLLAGTSDGRILAGREESWREVARVPVSEDDRRAFGVRSLAVV